MLIIQIALGIVLAFIILSYSSTLLNIGTYLLITIAALLLIILVWEHFTKFAVILVGSIILYLIVVSIRWISEKCTIYLDNNWPEFSSLLAGKAPYNTLKMFPIRFIVSAIFVFGGAFLISLIFLILIIGFLHLSEMLDLLLG